MPINGFTMSVAGKTGFFLFIGDLSLRVGLHYSTMLGSLNGHWLMITHCYIVLYLLRLVRRILMLVNIKLMFA